MTVAHLVFPILVGVIVVGAIWIALRIFGRLKASNQSLVPTRLFATRTDYIIFAAVAVIVMTGMIVLQAFSQVRLF
jgi:hypothetical protein